MILTVSDVQSNTEKISFPLALKCYTMFIVVSHMSFVLGLSCPGIDLGLILAALKGQDHAPHPKKPQQKHEPKTTERHSALVSGRCAGEASTAAGRSQTRPSLLLTEMQEVGCSAQSGMVCSECWTASVYEQQQTGHTGLLSLLVGVLSYHFQFESEDDTFTRKKEIGHFAEKNKRWGWRHTEATTFFRETFQAAKVVSVKTAALYGHIPLRRQWGRSTSPSEQQVGAC